MNDPAKVSVQRCIPQGYLAAIALLALTCKTNIGIASSSEAPPPPQFELSVTPAYQGKEDLRTGGQLSAHTAIVRAAYTNSLNDGSFFGLTLGYDYKDYDISRHTALGAEPPWTIVRHIGVGAPIFLAGSGSWGYYFSPALEISRADGAKWSDSLQYGGLVAAIKQVDAQRRIGFGISLSEALERVYAYPVVIVDWQITDRLRIANPSPGGAADGAGVELDYSLGPWVLGAGSGYDMRRFRLSAHGALPDGIGQQRQNIIYLQARYTLGHVLDVAVFTGAAFEGRVRVEDAQGHLLSERKSGAAPLAGLTFHVRF